MRIALWNGSGFANTGDRLIDAVTRRELTQRLSGAECLTFTPWPSAYCANRLIIDGDGHWSGEGCFEAIVIGSGGLITGPPFSDPCAQSFLLGPYPEKFRDRCPVIWSGICSNTQFLAPLRESWRKFVCAAAARMTIRTVRNERTKSFLVDCGVRESIDVVPDVAVLASSPDASRTMTPGRPTIAVGIGRPTVPQSLIDYVYECAKAVLPDANHDVMQLQYVCEDRTFSDDAYAERLCKILRPLLERYRVAVFGFGAMYGDEIAAERVAARLPEARHVVLEEPGGADAIELFRSADCVVAPRLHACILALATGTPFVALDPYFDDVVGTSKIMEFLDQIGLRSRHLTLAEIEEDPQRLQTMIEAALQTDRDMLLGAHELLARKTRDHFDRLAEAIGSLSQ